MFVNSIGALDGSPFLIRNITTTTGTDGYLCFSHVVVRGSARPRPIHPGIVHITAPVFETEAPPIRCTNVKEVLTCHENYWRDRTISRSKTSGDPGESDDDPKGKKEPDTSKDSSDKRGTRQSSSSKTADDPNYSSLKVANVESLDFILTPVVDLSIQLGGSQERPMTDLEYEEALRKDLGEDIKVVPYKGTVEEMEHANEVALKATSGLWFFEGDFSDEDGEFSDSADDLA